MTTLTATRGLPGSGKTTYAKSALAVATPGSLVRMNRDDLRIAMHGKPYQLHKTEGQVSQVQHRSIETLLRDGVNVIVDDTNLRMRHLRNLANIAWRAGADFEVKDFTDVPLDDCLARNAKRERPVPEHVIRSMHDRYLAGRSLPLPIPEKPEATTGKAYVPDDTLPRAIMVDIDGTVALHGDRDPYDTTKYAMDGPNEPVISAVRAMWQAGHFVVFCSGRDETFREVTETWIRAVVGIWPPKLFMRPAGDKRRDDIVKLELFDKYIRDNWNVRAVFDDRDRVVKAWRSIGLTVFQVAPGDF